MCNSLALLDALLLFATASLDLFSFAFAHFIQFFHPRASDIQGPDAWLNDCFYANGFMLAFLL